MSNNISQVPQLLLSDEQLDGLLEQMVRLKPFERDYVRSGRAYPGEAEANAILRYFAISSRRSRERAIISRSFDTLRLIEYAVQRRHVKEIERLTKKDAPGALERVVLRQTMTVGWRDEGLVVEPKTEAGLAALGILLLANKRLLTRIRICAHCKRWFYARFKHQMFCADGNTKCQWNHYHSPEWRKKHREQNRKHQRAYRERTFGKRSR